MPSARIELAILSLHTEVILVIRFTTKPRGPEIGIPTLLDWLIETLLRFDIYIVIVLNLRWLLQSHGWSAAEMICRPAKV